MFLDRMWCGLLPVFYLTCFLLFVSICLPLVPVVKPGRFVLMLYIVVLVKILLCL